MNILMIDMFGNAMEIAAVVGACTTNSVDQVYVMADRVCPKVWQARGVNVHPKVPDAHGVETFIREHSINLVCNFDPWFTDSGVEGVALSNGCTFFGSDSRFSRTEMDRMFFKNMLLENGIKTPAIRFSGVAEEVVAKSYTFIYPLVVKPAISLVSPKIIRSPAQLEEHMQLYDKKLAGKAQSQTWLIEEFIDAVDGFSVDYAVGHGEFFIRQTSSVTFVEKSLENLVGVTAVSQPHPQEDRYMPVVKDVLSLLAAQGYCGLGFFQGLINKQGELFIIENNARPISCGRSVGIEKDIMPIITAAMEGGLLMLQDVDVFEEAVLTGSGQRNFVFEARVVSHKSKRIPMSHQLLEKYGDLITPFSAREVDGDCFSFKNMVPSIFSIVASRGESLEPFETNVASFFCMVAPKG